jgi:hypothetical protein
MEVNTQLHAPDDLPPESLVSFAGSCVGSRAYLDVTTEKKNILLLSEIDSVLDLMLDPEDGDITLFRNLIQLVSNCVIIEQVGIAITGQACIFGGGGRFVVSNSFGTSTILIGAYRGSLQNFHVNFRIVLRLGHPSHFLP